MKKLRFITSVCVMLSMTYTLVSQNVAITDDGSYNADASAMLDVKSTSKGLLIPRVTSGQRDAISSPAKGLMVFVTSDSTFYYYDGSSWVTILSSNVPDNDWTISGSNMYSGVTGNVGIGIPTPGQRLDVNGTVQATGFSLPTGATNGFVLTSDAGGMATWKAAPATVYAQVFTVAQSGGDFATITAALAACVTPTVNNRYLIRVMPGTYLENVTCKQYVRLQGSGKYTCHINGTITTADSCTIEGFYIDHGVVCQATSPTIMENIITNFMGNGIDVTPPANPWIMQNEILDCDGWGIHCNGWDAYAWIFGNKILRNGQGGIHCTNSSPTISNNQILENHNFGIYHIGGLGTPDEPTIDDNQIGLTDPENGG
ncbi:MAG: right-handed parallel beta-helix repeat-containing protein, partial [Bacteroidales bacterium]|nr:right-handed parallel beta-helix repeat-containing protein [Bacteroidales bacterium]